MVFILPRVQLLPTITRIPNEHVIEMYDLMYVPHTNVVKLVVVPIVNSHCVYSVVIHLFFFLIHFDYV